MATIETREYQQDGKTVKRYKVTVTLKGCPRTSKTFDRKTDAVEWAKKTEYEFKRQRAFGPEHHKFRTVGEAIERYSKDLELTNPPRYAGIKPQLAWWQKKLGSLKLGDLSADLILRHREQMKGLYIRNNPKLKKLSNARVNRNIAVLSRVLTLATDQWGWLVKNPMAGIEKLPEPSGRTRFLQDDELGRLMTAAAASDNADMPAIIKLALTTGARRGEIEKIRFKDVDLNKSKILLPITKNQRPRILYLVEPAYSLIKEICERPRPKEQEYLFVSPHEKRRANSFRRAWNTILKRAELEDFRFHDLRHTAASFMAQHGAGLHQISEILGHSSYQVTKRYTHLVEKDTAAIVASTAAKVFSYDKQRPVEKSRKLRLSK